MSNPYQQFNIRPPSNTRLQSVPANAYGVNPALGAVRMLSPAVANHNQRLYDGLYSNVPGMAVGGEIGQVPYAHPQWADPQFAQYMANFNSGMNVAPGVPLDFGQQAVGLHNLASYANMQTCALMQQYMSGFASALHSRVPFVQPQVASMQQLQNNAAVSVVPVIRANHDVSADTLSGDIDVPFRSVQWNPSTVQQEISVPQQPSAVDMKQEYPEMSQMGITIGSITANDALFDARGVTETSAGESEPVVYMDVAMDNRSAHIDARQNAADSRTDVVTTKTNTRTRKRKGVRSKSTTSAKLPKSNSAVTLKMCTIPLVPIDRIIDCRVSNDRVEESSVAENAVVNPPEFVVDEVCLANNQASVESETYCDVIPVPEAYSITDYQDMSVRAVEENEIVSDLVPIVDESACDGSKVSLLEDGSAHCDVDQLISTDEDGEAEDPPPDDDSCLSDDNAVMEDGVELREVWKFQDISVHAAADKSDDFGDADKLIESDEDVEPDDLPRDDAGCLSNDDAGSEKSMCYEVVPNNSDTLLLDMECDGEKDSDALRVMLPTKTLKTNFEETDSSKTLQAPVLTQRQPVSSRATVLPMQPVSSQATVITLQNRMEGILLSVLSGIQTPVPVTTAPLSKNTVAKTPLTKNTVSSLLQASKLPVLPSRTANDPVTVDADADDSDDVVCLESDQTPTKTTETRSQRLAASVCREKLSISAAQDRVESIEIGRSENCLLGVPLQSSFFRFEAQSSEVFRLLSMERAYVPRSVLSQLTGLTSSVDTAVVGKERSYAAVPGSLIRRIPHGESRTLLFQCLFCPYGEFSAKRVMAHVKQQHSKYASFLQRGLLPPCQVVLHIYCRHCNFITYDTAAMFVHFSVFHKVPGMRLPQPKDVEQDRDWAPSINPGARAKEFPFYCCPNCSYVDVSWHHIIHHILKRHSTESMFLGCVVKMIMVGRTSKHSGSFTYQSLASEERYRVARKDIYACICCRYFSFYPVYAFCHYVTVHRSLEMLYVCAASPSCSKRFTSVEDVVSHIQSVHVAMNKLQFQCTATLLDSLDSVQLNVSAGKLTSADVPMYIHHQSSSAASFSNRSSVATIEIDDNDGDSDGDVIVLNEDDSKMDDVEPDLVSLSDDSDGSSAEAQSAKSSGAAQPVSNQQRRPEQLVTLAEKILEQREKLDDVEPDVVHIVEDEQSEAGALDTVDTACHDEAQADNLHKDEALKATECSLQSDTSKEIDVDELQSIQNPSNWCAEGSNPAIEVECGVISSKDVDSTTAVTDESSVDVQSVQNLARGTTHVDVDGITEDSICANNTPNCPRDGGAVASNSLNDIAASSTNDSVNESQLELNHEMNQMAAEDSAEDPENDMNRLLGSGTLDADVVCCVGYGSKDDNATGLLVCQKNDSSPCEEGQSISNEVVAADWQSGDAVTGAFDWPKSVSLFDDGFDFGDDALSVVEPQSCRFESGACSESQKEMLLLPEQLTVEQNCRETERLTETFLVLPESVTNEVADASLQTSITVHSASSDDTFGENVTESEQLPASADSCSKETSAPENPARGHCVDTAVSADPSCTSRSSESVPDSEVGKGNEPADDRPASADRLRFKSLAGFRFSGVSSFQPT